MTENFIGQFIVCDTNILPWMVIALVTSTK